MTTIKHQPEAQGGVEPMRLQPGTIIDYVVEVRGKRSFNAKRSCTRWYGEMEADHAITLPEGLQLVMDLVLPRTGAVQLQRSISATVAVRPASTNRRVRVQ